MQGLCPVSPRVLSTFTGPGPGLPSPPGSRAPNQERPRGPVSKGPVLQGKGCRDKVWGKQGELHNPGVPGSRRVDPGGFAEFPHCLTLGQGDSGDPQLVLADRGPTRSLRRQGGGRASHLCGPRQAVSSP